MSNSRRWRSILGTIALASTSIVMTLGMFEVALRIAGYQPIYSVYSRPEILWRKDALLGWSHEPGAEGTYVGPRPWPTEFESPVRINSIGLRGPEIEALPSQGVRIMLLGDSMVAGFEVLWEETFGAVLEERLNQLFEFPIQVVNAAVRGYGTDQSFLYFRERGKQLRPDIVVFLHGGNDEADNITLHRMRRIFGKGGLHPLPDGTFSLVGYPIPDYEQCSEWLLDTDYAPRRVDSSFEASMCEVQTQLSDRSALFTFLSMRIRRNPEFLRSLYRLGSPAGAAEGAAVENLGKPAEAARTQLTVAILDALHKEVNQSGGELLHIVIPGLWGELDPARFAGPGASLVEIHDDFGQQQYRFENDGHLNRDGHRLMAERIEPALVARIRELREPR